MHSYAPTVFADTQSYAICIAPPWCSYYQKCRLRLGTVTKKSMRGLRYARCFIGMKQKKCANEPSLRSLGAQSSLVSP